MRKRVTKTMLVDARRITLVIEHWHTKHGHRLDDGILDESMYNRLIAAARDFEEHLENEQTL